MCGICFIIPFYLVENGQLATSSVPQFHTDEVLLRQCHLLPIDLEGRTVPQQITAEVLDGVHRVGDQEHWCRRPGGVPDLGVPLVDSELALNALVPHVEDATLDLRPGPFNFYNQRLQSRAIDIPTVIVDDLSEGNVPQASDDHHHRLAVAGDHLLPAHTVARSRLQTRGYKFSLLWGEAQLCLPYVC